MPAENLPEHASDPASVAALISVGVTMNIALGTLANLLKLPLYLDAIGTITITLIVGFRAGAIAGGASFLIGGLIVNPVWLFFIGTQVGIAGYIRVAAARGLLGWRPDRLSRLPSVLGRGVALVILGAGLGVWAALLSTPVLVLVFGGLTGNGMSLVVAFLIKSGESMFDAVLFSGVAAEPVDKTLQLLIAISLVRSLPESLKRRLPSHGRLVRNGLASAGWRSR